MTVAMVKELYIPSHKVHHFGRFGNVLVADMAGDPGSGQSEIGVKYQAVGCSTGVQSTLAGTVPGVPGSLMLAMAPKTSKRIAKPRVCKLARSEAASLGRQICKTATVPNHSVIG